MSVLYTCNASLIDIGVVVVLLTVGEQYLQNIHDSADDAPRCWKYNHSQPFEFSNGMV